MGLCASKSASAVLPLDRRGAAEGAAEEFAAADGAQAYRRRLLKFHLTCEKGRVGWIRVSFLRRRRGAPVLPRRQEIPAEEIVVGAPPLGGQAWVVSHPWHAKQHADPSGAQLLQLVAKLDELKASDGDVVFFDYWSMPQCSCHGVDDRTPEDKEAFDSTMKVLNALYSSEFSRVVVIAQVEGLAEMHWSVKDASGAVVAIEPNWTPYVTRGWCFFELLTSLSFQTCAGLDPFIDEQIRIMCDAMMRPANFSNQADIAYVNELMVKRLREMIEGKSGWEECEAVIRAGHVQLLRVGFLRLLARSGGILSRRQELPPHAFAGASALGSLRSQSLFAISHAWCDRSHPDPRGFRVRDLVRKFDRLHVHDDALVFLDWASAYQKPRMESETRSFLAGLAATACLYSNPRMQVLVCTDLPGESSRRSPYFESGWCLFEITMAILSGTVLFDELHLVDLFLEKFFLPQLRRKRFTKGEVDMDIVTRKFRDLLNQRAGVM